MTNSVRIFFTSGLLFEEGGGVVCNRRDTFIYTYLTLTEGHKLPCCWPAHLLAAHIINHCGPEEATNKKWQKHKKGK